MLGFFHRWWRGAGPLGERGERLAARWLRRRGYRIVSRNLRAGRDEADLVALAPDGRTLVIVEVKTREDDHIPPEEQVGEVKRSRMARLAQRLQQSRAYRDRPMRFDVVAVVWPRHGAPTVTHYPHAFDSPR